MLELLNKLRNHSEEFIELINIIIEIKNNGDSYLEKHHYNINEKTNYIFGYLYEIDIYNLLESIYVLSNKAFKKKIIEQEEKYTNIIRIWSILIPVKVEPNIPENNTDALRSFNNILFETELILDNNIKRISQFCKDFLGSSSSNIFTFYDYKTLFQALEYYEKKIIPKKFDKNSNYRNQMTIRFNFDNYINQLKHYNFNDSQIQLIRNNKSLIKSKNIKIKFLDNTMYADSSVALDESVLEELLEYLKTSNNIDNHISNKDFKLICRSKSLLTIKSKKIKWKYKKADAVRFSIFVNLSLLEFNNCFIFSDNKKLELKDLGKGWNKFDDFLLSLDDNYKNKNKVKSRYLNMKKRETKKQQYNI